MNEPMIVKNLDYPKDREAMADQFILVLNELLLADRKAIEALVEFRVLCDEMLADHPTVQVLQDERCYKIGFLGVLNGLVGVIESGPRTGWGLITAVFNDDGELQCFRRTVNAD